MSMQIVSPDPQELYWFSREFRVQRPLSRDVFRVAQEQYEKKAYRVTVRCLNLYNMMHKANNESPITGYHLLGYAHLHLGNTADAVHNFLLCTQEGCEDDWQMVVEALCEIGQHRQ
eukprot:TRINITY_DN2358_c0_g1_i1.p1 TRINITY_DN2358_c0_g1~~TRINITY_DN2358_c0_g1_i1.p1  ORF type:complete len:116 (-),score=8.60 TRINITY_DN2358_c0_g1_i1:8-355(-)